MTPESACILVIEDEPEIRRALRVGLQSQGYAVDSAESSPVRVRLS